MKKILLFIIFNAIGTLSYAQNSLEKFSNSDLRDAVKVLFRSSSKDDVTKKISSKEVDSMSKNFQKLLKYDQEKILKTLKILSTLPQDDEDDDDAHAAVLEKSLNKERLEKKDFEKIVEEVDSSNLPFILDANTEQFVWSKLHEVLNDK